MEKKSIIVMIDNIKYEVIENKLRLMTCRRICALTNVCSGNDRITGTDCVNIIGWKMIFKKYDGKRKESIIIDEDRFAWKFTHTRKTNPCTICEHRMSNICKQCNTHGKTTYLKRYYHHE